MSSTTTVKPHKHAEVLRAIADGKEVQWRSPKGEQIWYDAFFRPFTPITDPDLLWRVKPEPKPDTIVHGHFSLYGDFQAHYFNSYVNNANVRITFDGETGKLKNVEVL